MKHDPEKAAASYLSGAMKPRRRAGFERHMMECEQCWHEVRAGRLGRSMAESGRELAPQSLREQVRAVVAATPSSRRRWGLSWGIPVLTAAMILAAVLVFGTFRNSAQPPLIDAVLSDYRNSAPSGEEIAAKLPPRLGDLRHVASYTDALGDLDVKVHSYRDPAGHEVLVYQADRTFPVAAGAEHSADGKTWTAAVDDVVLFCADYPVPSLVVGDDQREVTMAVRELGLQ